MLEIVVECVLKYSCSEKNLDNSREKNLAMACNFIIKETLAQVFSCEFCEIIKNTFFEEHLQTTASVDILRNVGGKNFMENDNEGVFCPPTLPRNDMVSSAFLVVC